MSWTDPIDDGIDYLDEHLAENGANPERIPIDCREELVRHVRQENTIVGGYTLPENLRYADQLSSLADDLAKVMNSDHEPPLTPGIKSILEDYDIDGRQ
jgi:hypothetical protein